MDHLFHVRDSGLASVPLRADVNDLSAARMATGSWDKDRVRTHGDLQGHTPDETYSFFQSWLYFGFLDRFFKDTPDFEVQDFVTLDDSGRRVVTTSRLQFWLTEWFAHVTRTMTVQYVQTGMYEELRNLFSEVYSVAMLYCSVGRNAPYNGPVYPGVSEELSLSILLLFSALEKAASQITARRFHFDLGCSRLLIRRLQDAGWCPADVEWFAIRSIDTIYSVCALDRPNPDLTHLACQPWQCMATHVEDESKYEQAHAEECTGCPDRTIGIEGLAAIVDRDEIPLVSLNDSADDLDLSSTPLKIADTASQRTSFVALSHVWSDGLGNPTCNAMPLCQLRRIQEMVDAVVGATGASTPVHWWCDTLCVPARGTSDESRKCAIQAMRAVYQGATQVLVLDRCLMSHERDVTAIEAYLYLLTSRWLRRLWTFQEGFLGAQILIQFRDGAASLSALYRTMAASRSPWFLYSWYDNDCIELLKPFVEKMEMEQNPSIAIYRAVASRNTSRRCDETICIANVQGIDIKTLLDIDELDWDSRMEQYLKLVRKLPVVLLFQALPRLSTPGFQWAPSSLLTRFRGSPTSIVYGDHADMRVDESGHGVDVELPGLRLEHTELPSLETGHHFGATITDAACIETCYVVYYAPGEAFGEKEYQGRSKTLIQPALILYHDVRSSEFESFDRGVLVDVRGSGVGGRLVVDYIALTGLRRVPVTVYAAQFRKSPSFTVWRGTVLPETTQWRVS